jgi:uncharacterized SAM-binding protein YcdF (DUF218 family)
MTLAQFRSPLSIIASWLDVSTPNPTDRGDVLVVLGGGMRANGLLGLSTSERLDLAKDLYRRKKRPIVLADGLRYGGRTGAEIMRHALMTSGIPVCDLLLEDASIDTATELQHVLLVMERLGLVEPVFCTSPYHTRRVRFLFRQLASHRFHLAPMPTSELYNGALLRRMMLVIRETAALARMRWRRMLAARRWTSALRATLS